MHSRPVTVGAAPDPMKPTVVEPPAGSCLFQSAGSSITALPIAECLPLQVWVMVWLPWKLKCTIQFESAVVARTATSPWNPPPHELVVEYVAVHVPPAGGGVLDDGGLLGGLLGGGPLLGGVDGSWLGGGMVLSPTPVTSPLPPSKVTSEQP
jgi:hypothetical protein